ncbi:MAG: hypothetical protein AB4040_09775 [Synechococcus sp.]
MGLRIVSEQFESKTAPNIPSDGYSDRLRKYIPTEAVAYWLAVSSMIQSAGDDIPKDILLWIVFAIGLAFTFGWTRMKTDESGKSVAWTQIVLSCGAFVIWVFATGGPFSAWEWYRPLYGSLALATYTTAIPLVIPPEK